MQLAISGISIDYHGGVANQPIENEFRSYIFSDRGKNGINAELSESATFDATNNIITYKDLSFSVDENGIISFATTNNQNTHQWVLVADNDNDGVISGGDEIAPLINSIQNESFYVLHNDGGKVCLTTKFPVDYVTNSQSSTAPNVTYDMAYCNKDGEYVIFVLPRDTPSEDEYGNPSNHVHCTGTYTKAYRDRLVSAGLTLIEFSDTGCPDASIPLIDMTVHDMDFYGIDSNDDDALNLWYELRGYWCHSSNLLEGYFERICTLLFGRKLGYN